MENKIKQIIIEIDTEKQDLASVYWYLNIWVSSQLIQGYRTLDKDEQITLFTDEEIKQMNSNNKYIL